MNIKGNLFKKELKKSGSKISTTVICPNAINTGMFQGITNKLEK